MMTLRMQKYVQHSYSMSFISSYLLFILYLFPDSCYPYPYVAINVITMCPTSTHITRCLTLTYIRKIFPA